MANYKSIYTGPQIDEGITRANSSTQQEGSLQEGEIVVGYNQGTIMGSGVDINSITNSIQELNDKISDRQGILEINANGIYDVSRYVAANVSISTLYLQFLPMISNIAHATGSLVSLGPYEVFTFNMPTIIDLKLNNA